MAAPAFETEVMTIPEVHRAETIVIKGSATHQEAPALLDELTREVAGSEAERLVLALGEVDKIDTSGAAVLFEAWALGRKRGMRVLLCSPSESVIRMFRLAGFEEILGSCCPTPDHTRETLLQ